MLPFGVNIGLDACAGPSSACASTYAGVCAGAALGVFCLMVYLAATLPGGPLRQKLTS